MTRWQKLAAMAFAAFVGKNLNGRSVSWTWGEIKDVYRDIVSLIGGKR